MTAPNVTSNHGLFQQLFESSPDPAWIIDEQRFVACNEVAMRTLGYTSRDEFLNVHPSRLSPPRQADGQDSHTKADAMMALARDKGLHRFEWVHTKADGTNFLAEVTLTAVEIDQRQVIYCVWRDITERSRIAAELLGHDNLLLAIIENIPGGVSVIDAHLRLTAHNRQFQSLLDLPDSLFEKADLNFEDVIRFNAQRGDYGPGDILNQVASRVTLAREFLPHKLERVRPNGQVLEIRGAPLPGGGMVTIYLDITERKRMEEQVRQLAFYDVLTKLPNRSLLSERLSQIMAASRRSGRYGALLFLDLDHFKPLNDDHGHAAGDLLLIEAAKRLKACVREVDTVARFGGDEFVVLLGDLNADPNESSAQAGSVAEKIRLALSNPYRLTLMHEGKPQSDIEHHCTTSIGVVVFVDHELSQDHVLRWADAAMYHAKNAGRNQIRFHDATA